MGHDSHDLTSGPTLHLGLSRLCCSAGIPLVACMPILLVIAGLLHADTAAVQVSASRQVSVSEMRAVKRIKLSVYGVTVCAEDSVSVPLGRVTAALATRGIPVEFPDFLPLVLLRGQQESALGHMRTGLEIGSGLTSAGLAVAKVGGYWAALPAVVGLLLNRTRSRQEEILQVLTPLAAKLLRPGEVLVPARGACHAGFVLSSGDVSVAEVEIRVPVPDAPIVVNRQDSFDSWPRPVAVEYKP